MPSAADLLRAARNPSSPSGARISTQELREAFDAAKAPAPGDPAGKPLTPEEAALFANLDPSELTWWARNYVLGGIQAQIPGLVQTGGGGGAGQVRPVPEKRGHPVFLTTNTGFAVDAAGNAPADDKALVSALHDAGKWLQASFGTNDNLFKTAGLDAAGKKAVLAQFQGALARDLQGLAAPQREQLLGSVAALTTELVKSIEFVPQMPAQNAELIALRDEAFRTLKATLEDPRVSALVKRGIVGYLAKADSFQAKLTAPQKAELSSMHAALFPQAPADYAKWDAQGKDRIVVDHVSGQGENFVYGIVKQFQNEGLDPGRPNSPKFTLLHGDTRHGPCVLEAKIPAGHPLNKWGREMTVEVRVREFRRDMYQAMGDPNVDVVHYGGHSNFGRNTLDSLKNAPPQQGDKVVLRDLCAGSDTMNAEAHVYPEASLNSVTSVGSSYFRLRDDPTVGKYAYESEGFAMLMSVTRGMLGKSDWASIGKDLERRANWWGHASNNNWTHPGDPRVGSFVDDDKDGVPNVFDVLPSYDTTDVAGSTANEFVLTAPAEKADQISGGRAFQAVQYLNTAAAYNALLEPVNKERKAVPDPNGIWFDAKDDPSTYVKFRKGPNGEHFVQMSTALADMTQESLRALLYFELVRYVGAQNPRLFADVAERNAMALVFATAAVEYDDSWRDREIMDGLKKLYGIPSSVSFSDLQSALSKADTVRHNYTGDIQAAREIAAKYGAELRGAGVGDPAIRVT